MKKKKTNIKSAKILKVLSQQLEKMNLEKNKFNAIELILIFIMALLFGIILGEMIFSNGTSTDTITKGYNNNMNEIENVYNTLIEEYIGEVSQTELKEAAIKGMMNLLEDNYSLYYDKNETEEIKEELSGSFYGMGAEIYQGKDGLITINKVYKNSPAEKAGLKKGDKYLKIDGKDITKKDLTEISKMIKGENNKKISLTVKRGDKEITTKLTTAKIDIPTVESEIIKKDSQSIGYLHISLFASNTDEQFEKHLNKLNNENINKLIIDIRDNIGGDLDTVINIASNFLTKKDVIVQTVSKKQTKKIYATKNNDKKYEIVVLINGGSASGSEVLASALEENINATLIGTTTYGKGTVQKTKTLSSGNMVKYTIETWKTSKGKEINKKGITPTIKEELDDKYYKSHEKEDDNQLQKAINLLLTK